MPMYEQTMLVNELRPLPLDWQPDDFVDLWKVQPRHYCCFIHVKQQYQVPVFH